MVETHQTEFWGIDEFPVLERRPKLGLVRFVIVEEYVVRDMGLELVGGGGTLHATD